MKTILASLALIALPLAATAQPAPVSAQALDLDHRLLLRCSATFALVANRQAAGEAWALAFPAMAERGREFFVAASAQVLDEAGITTEQLGQLFQSEAQSLVTHDQIAAMMPVCLPILEQSGL
ncbi:hypothetical protein [Alteraurantiacibacter palmitatis]|uniref:Uncharacterized protein n=1 Tax=Alteraurantiacibacter palmitatis TaxID=2054628 RepID=A0ABV7E527_9SPHN